MTWVSRQEALQAVLAPVPLDHTVVFANGYISRGGVSLRQGAPDFPMIGSMGLAASIGLGLVWSRPDRPVLVADGDGNLMMGLSALPVIGCLRDGSLVHVVVDDGVYASTGGQPTGFPHVDLPNLARACGYASASAPRNLAEASARVDEVWGSPGAHLVHVRVSPTDELPQPRVSSTPEEIANAVRRAYTGSLEGTPTDDFARPSAARNVSLPSPGVPQA